MSNLFRHLFGTQQEESEGTWVAVNSNEVSNIVGYFDRTTIRTQIRDAITARYGVGIRQVKDAAGGVLETYTRDEFKIRVDAGIAEAITIGFGPKIEAALATLFTERGQRFTLTSEETDDVTEATELLEDQRKNGGFLQTMVDADKRSVQCASSIVFVEFASGNLQYSFKDIGKIQAYFDKSIEENGEPRPVDMSDLEDCTYIVIQTGQVDLQTSSYLAIFGRSEAYPQGRYVAYESDSDGRDVPDFGPDVFEYLIDGKQANPLSYYANLNPELQVPEFPIAIMRGGVGNESDLFPFSDTLFNESLEADVSASHYRATGNDAARGTMAISRTEQAAGKALPRSLHGAVDLPAGMSLEHISHDAAATLSGLEGLDKELIHTGGSYGVPDYMLVSEDYTVEASSGIALQVKTRPLKKKREYRTEINQPTVGKVFEIEKAYLSLHHEGDDSAVAQLESCTQNWDPGDIRLPEDKKSKSERIISLKKDGIYDEIEAIQDWYDLPTEDEAIAQYEKMKQRREDFPPLNGGGEETERRPVGLLRNLNRGGQQQS
jgi:hypothetical protein